MDERVIMALIMLNLTGGEQVEDLRGLEEDDVKKKWARPLFPLEADLLPFMARCDGVYAP